MLHKLFTSNYEKKLLGLLVFVALILFIILLFFDSSSLSLSIPSGDFAKQIWTIRIQIGLKIVLSATAIGLSNYLVQLITKNKLADVSIMGVNTFQQLGVALFVLFASQFFLNFEQSYIFSFIYLIIGCFSSIIFYLVAMKTNLSSSLILIYGILLNVAITAIVYFVLTSNFTNSNIVKNRFNYYQNKVFGGIQLASDFSSLYVAIGLVFICLFITYCLRLKIIASSSLLTKTKSLGFNNKNVAFLVILIVSILGSVIFSLIGIVGFVGISVSFLANYFFNSFHYHLLGSIFWAIIILLLSQYVQISIAYFASGISLTTIAGLISCFIFIVFLFLKK